MQQVPDARFASERERFALRLACEDCALFDPARERCAHGYPTEPHRERSLTATLVFCKDFDLA